MLNCQENCQPLHCKEYAREIDKRTKLLTCIANIQVFQRTWSIWSMNLIIITTAATIIMEEHVAFHQIIQCS